MNWIDYIFEGLIITVLIILGGILSIIALIGITGIPIFLVGYLTQNFGWGYWFLMLPAVVLSVCWLVWLESFLTDKFGN